jgi:hypothetical protein
MVKEERGKPSVKSDLELDVGFFDRGNDLASL